MGFIDTLKYIFLLLLAQVAGAIVYGELMFLFIAYGIPLLLSAIFS